MSVHLFLINLIISSFLVSAESPKCPTAAKINPKTLQPEVIGHFAKVHKLKSPDELICCIAQLPNIAIAISPNSIAGQDGDYLNPRVLIVQTDGQQNGTHVGLNAIFTVNSGANHLNQKDSVEMLFNDPKGLVFTDIDFSKHKAEVSGRNPEACMLCHGDSGRVPKNGARPIFDPAPWPRFLMETPPATSSRDIFGENVCAERAKLEPLLERKTSEALNSNPRYACIKDKPRIRIDTLDAMLRTENDKRIIKMIRSSPDYSKYKYSIVGAEVCDFLPEEFIPESRLKKMTNVGTLSVHFSSLQNKEDLIKEVEKVQLKQNRIADLQDVKKIEYKTMMEKNNIFKFSDEVMDSRHCTRQGLESLDSAKFRELMKENFFKSKNTTFNQYTASGLAYETQGNSNLRFLFESRGMDISDWGMSSTTGSYTRTFRLVAGLLEYESENSPLKRIMTSNVEKEKKCELLKAESMRVFGEVSLPQPLDQNDEVVR